MTKPNRFCRRLFLTGSAAVVSLALASCGGAPLVEPNRDNSAAQRALKRVRELLEGLQGKVGPSEREAARTAFITMGDSAVPGLVEALADKKKEIRKSALWALGEMAEQDDVVINVSAATGVVADLLTNDVVWEMRERAAFTLEAIIRKNPEDKHRAKAEKALINALNDNSLEVRKGAVWALRVVGGAAAATALVRLLKDEEIRENAVEALVEIGEHSIPVLIEALQKESLHKGAVWALGDIGEPAVSPLIESLRHKNKNVRKGAAWALARIKDERAVQPLQELAETETVEEVKNMAKTAVNAIPH